MSSPSDPARVVDLVLARGRDAMSFVAVESGMRHWRDAEPPAGTGALVAYVDTKRAWVAACSPLVDAPDDGYAPALSKAALAFVAAARASGRRACFFGSEAPEVDGLSRLLIGEQPIFVPRAWLADLANRKSLREQLRRARAKGVTVRSPSPAELEEGAPLRLAIERLAAEWLKARHIEPMHFLVALEPFCEKEHHRYFVAEVGGRAVGFLSAVPIGARRAWLVEDVVRGASAPNGTTETLIVALMRDVEQSEYVTLGLTPLAGDVAWPLRAARFVSRPLFDFEGLRAFRERLRPERWDKVWLAYPSARSPVLPVADALGAFARGSLTLFAVRSFAHHPSGLPWALSLPLPFWTAALAAFAALGRASVLGFSQGELWLWVAFDALMLFVLVRSAMRPRRPRLLVAAAFAGVDAALSLGHLAWVGLGSTPIQASLRVVAAAAPVTGALLLAWATTRAEGAMRPTALGSPRARTPARRRKKRT